MKKIKSKDIREVIEYDGDIVVNEYNYFNLAVLYNNYLKYKDIKLTYNNIDLKEYAKSHKLEKGNPEKKETWEPIVDKEITKINKMIKKAYLFSCFLVFEVVSSYTNYSHHEDINIENSKYILSHFLKDIDGDGIREILIDQVGEYEHYIEPTDSFLYSVTNPLYYLSNKNRISSAYSMKKAAEQQGVKAIEYDNEIYTISGYMSYVTYDADGTTFPLNVPYSLDSKEQAEELIAYFLDNAAILDYSNIDYIETIEVKSFDEFPKLYKSKKR